MELTVEQALEQGVSAHKEGKLQEAESLYRSILQSQPAHPDANHNLGLIAVSMNMSEMALPLFKTALEVKPGIKQFWVSYTDALIKAKQFKNAKRVLEKAKKSGFSGVMLDALSQQLSPVTIDPTPSKEKLNSLLGCYQSGRYDDAKKLAISITKQFPNSQFSWKVLAAVLKQTGRLSESLVASQTALKLDPQDPEAHYNLSITMKELGRLEEAEAISRHAIKLKPDFAKAHNNLAITLQELGRLEEAEASYSQAIALKPNYAEAHNNLGNTLKELGKLEEAEAISRQAIELHPGFAEAHNNLAVTLQELGRSEEAEASYNQAIKLKPSFAEAHNNLAVTLQELGRLEEAEASCKQAIALKSDYAEAHSNLGVTLKELGRLEEAEASYSQAIALKSDYAEAHNNLGNTLTELGRLEEAEASCKQAIALKSDFSDAMLNLSIVLDYMNNLDEAILQLKNILKMDMGNCGLKAAVNLSIFRFLEDDFATSKKYLLASSKIQEMLNLEFKSYRVYWEYLLKILSWHENKSPPCIDFITDKKLYVIGESHALISHRLRVQSSGSDYLCKSLLIQGCKQWDLGNTIRNKYKTKFESIFRSLQKSSEVLLAIGEIDCRLDSGIIKHRNKFPEKNIAELVSTTVENYLNYIYKINSCYKHKIIMQGVPCPNIETKNISKEKIMELIDVTKKFNVELKYKSKKMGFGFLDVYKLTDSGDGLSNSIWHLDNHHLSPEGMHEAWRKYLSY